MQPATLHANNSAEPKTVRRDMVAGDIAGKLEWHFW
jgi:hypothetical protein